MKLDRLCYDKESYYQNGVLVGNWVEERFGRYKKNRFNHITIYKQDFVSKIAADKKENDYTYNTIKIRSEYGDSVASPPKTDDVGNFYDNFSTTYDLAYEYFPKWYKESVNRKIRFRMLRFEPTNEYLNHYGNLSSRNGLTNFKKEIWDCDVLDPRRSVSSIAKADYIKYNPETYQAFKCPRVQPVKVKCGNTTNLVYPQLPSNHPRILQLQKDPITWKNYNNNLQKCVCNFK